jgi:carboxyl-terminal processing protease
MRNSTLKSIGLVAAGAIAATAMWHAFDAAVAGNSDTYRQLNLFGDVFDRVRSDYVEVPDEEKLIDSAINGMLAALDPHSSYMNAKRFQDMQVQTRGEFGGLGIEVTMENGLVQVVAPIDDTPAERAGILSNDLITHIDGEQVMGLTLNEAVDKMRGKVNTPITLTIMRPGVDEPFDVRLVRAVIRIQAVRFEREDDIGYIRISSFNEKTFDNLKLAIESLRSEIGDDLKGYVLDLRNNPGGLLDQAISVSDAFLERGEVVSTRGRNPNETQRYSARSGDFTQGKPVVVLINGGSASASEIVAGALRDHERAKVIGTRSFGKGSVQTIIPLGGQGALRLTTARYYTPSGTSIQATGIVPDLLIEQDLPEEMQASANRAERGEASLRGHLRSENGEEQSGSSSYVPRDKKEDKQLQAAFDLLNGRTVLPTPQAASNTVEDATPSETPAAN